MIQDDLWISRLAAEAHISYDTSAKLWRALLEQLEVRLSSDMAVDMGYAGVWQLALVPEHIAQIAEQPEYYLVPPHLELRIVASGTHTSLSIVPLHRLIDALEVTSGIRPEPIELWVAAIPRILELQLGVGHRVSWPGIGGFSPHEGGFTLEVAQSFAEALNRPFSMFSPVLASAPERHHELAIRLYPSPEAILAPKAIIYTGEPDEVVQELDATHTEPVPEGEDTAEEDAGPEILEAPAEPITEESSVAETKETAEAIAEEAIEPQEPEPASSTSEEEAQGDTSKADRQRDERRKYRMWTLILLGVMAVLLGLFIWHLRSERAAAPLAPAPRVKPVVQPRPKPHTADSLPTQAKDSLPTVPPARQTAAPQAPEQAPAEPRRGRLAPAEDIVIETGDSLMDIAKAKYGHRAFWVYIYEENRELLPDPNNVPIGTSLRLPAARKYGIDPNDNNSISRALILQRSLIN